MAVSPTALGLDLKRARRQRKLTQKDLAALAAVDLATCAGLEAGRGTVGPLQAVLDALSYRFAAQPEDKTLGEWITETRQAAALSQQRLATLTQISKPTIIAIERGRGNLRSLCAVMTALALPVSLRPAEQSQQFSSRALPHTRVHTGDCLDVLRTMADDTYHTCITSPPFFHQRDYMIAGQIGLEPSPEEYIARLVEVFREVRRVLRRDGTLWVNIGDTFAGSRATRGALKRKDLMGIPWRLAFALQQDGWYLRQDIVIEKQNPLPEPVRDRCARAHEYRFLLSKSATYTYDAEALRERGATTNPGSAQRNTKQTHGLMSGGNTGLNAAKQRLRKELAENGFVTRHKRSVWPIVIPPNGAEHFAVFSESLVEPCILAGSPEGGTVLDPFGGSGTTARVALRLGRNADLIEINPRYAEMARKRCAQYILKQLTITTAP